MDDIMTVLDVTKYLQLHEMTVYRLARRGLIPAFRVGSAWRFKKSVLDEWMEKRLEVVL